MRISETSSYKVQDLLISYGVHDILGADKTAELAEEIIKLFEDKERG